MARNYDAGTNWRLEPHYVVVDGGVPILDVPSPSRYQSSTSTVNAFRGDSGCCGPDGTTVNTSGTPTAMPLGRSEKALCVTLTQVAVLSENVWRPFARANRAELDVVNRGLVHIERLVQPVNCSLQSLIELD